MEGLCMWIVLRLDDCYEYLCQERRKTKSAGSTIKRSGNELVAFHALRITPTLYPIRSLLNSRNETLIR